MKSTKKALFMSCLSLLLCVSMLVGTTFAWFTDSVTSGVNQIIAGNLDIEVSYKDDGEWKSIQGVNSLFSKGLWEPGHTEFVTLKIENKGTLALNYKLMVTPVSENGGINVDGQPFKLSDYLKFGTTTPADTEPTGLTRETARQSATNEGLLSQANMNQSGTMLAKAAGAAENPAQYVTLVIYMPETVGNEANYKTGTTAPQINLGITVLATQMEHEVDSFDETYDAGAVTHTDYAGVGAYYDYFEAVNETATSGDDRTFTVEKSGVAGVSGVTENANTPVDMVVTKSSDATVNFTGTVGDGHEVTGYDIKVTGQEPGSLVQAKLYVGTGLTNFVFYHDSNAMVVGTKGSLTNGEFFYDSTDGYVYFATTSFSPYQATYKAPVAAIGSAVYGTFADAMAVANGKTVTLLKSCSGNGIKVPSGSNVTVNFNGFTYNIDGTTVGSTGTETNGFQLLKDSTITFKNGVLTSDKAKLLIQNYSDLTLDNMVIDGTKLVGDKYAASNNNGNVTIKNTTINAASDGVAFDVYSFGSYTGANVTVENSVINGKIEVGASAGANISNLKLTIKSGTINGAIVPSEGFAEKISIEGGTFNFDPAEYVASGFASEKAGNKWVVGKVKAVAVEVTVGNGEPVTYPTWNEAIAAVKNVKKDISMKLLSNGSVEAWDSFVIDGYTGQSITLDGNGKTITGLKNMLFEGTWAGSGLTVKNLTIDGANIVKDAEDTKETVGVGAVVGMSDSSAVITIENVTLKNSHVEGGHWTGGLIGYVTGYNNANDGPVFNNTTIKNCTVSDNEITGKGSCGALIGHACGNPATKVSVSGTTVSGNTVSCTSSSTNKAGALFGTVGNAGLSNAWNGEMGGVFVNGCLVSNNSATSGGTVIARLYGRIATGKLTVDGAEFVS